MARTRLVKPGIFRNEYLWECAPLARYFWVGLWCHADYRGVVEWRPKRLKADILPCDECDVDALSAELVEHGFLVFFERGGQPYAFIPNFEKHQHPHKKERDAGSCLPEPPVAAGQAKPDLTGETAFLHDHRAKTTISPTKQNHIRRDELVQVGQARPDLTGETSFLQHDKGVAPVQVRSGPGASGRIRIPSPDTNTDPDQGTGAEHDTTVKALGCAIPIPRFKETRSFAEVGSAEELYGLSDTDLRDVCVSLEELDGEGRVTRRLNAKARAKVQSLWQTRIRSLREKGLERLLIDELARLIRDRGTAAWPKNAASLLNKRTNLGRKA